MKIINIDNQLLHKIKLTLEKKDFIVIDFDLLININTISYNYILDYIECLLPSYQINIKNYKKNRLRAEKTCKKEKLNLDNIYEKFINNHNLKAQLIKIENEVFIKFVALNNEMLQVYNYLVSSNKKIIIRNNTVFNNDTLTIILNKFKLKKIYKILKSNDLPNDYLLLTKTNNKHTKNLDNAILLKKDKYINENKFKVLIKKQKMNKNEAMNFSFICGFINNNLYSQDYYEQIGYGKFGILLYGFIQYLLKNINPEISRVYFLARDGYIIKKAFDILNKKENLESYYLYVSRSSLKKSIYNKAKNIKELLDIADLRYNFKYGWLLDELGLIEEDYANKISKGREEIISKSHITQITSDIESFKEIIKKRSIDTEKNLKIYLDKLKFNDHIAVVDIGYKGTIQHYLQTINNNFIEGYYICLDKKNIYKDVIAHEFLKCNENIYPYVGAFELFFSANHGSTKNYQNGSYELKNLEFKASEVNKILNIQNSALEFIQEFEKFESLLNLSLSGKECFALLRDVFLNPSSDDIAKLGSISFFDTELFQICQNTTLKDYLFNLKKFYYDYHNCSWKYAFCKKVFGTVKTTYILEFARKIIKKNNK